jgi:hypothetical protein
MKPLLRLITALMIIAAASALAQQAAAQDKNAAMRGRAIRMKYESGSIDGLRVTVCLMAGDTVTVTDASREFRKGDQIKIEFESNFDGYVYFVNVPPNGRSAVIYPDLRSGETNNLVRARQRYLFPRTGTLEFDDEQGTEVLQVVLAREPVAIFEDAIKNSGGMLGQTASSAAAELTGAEPRRAGIDASSTVNVVPQNLRPRIVRLAPPNNKDEKGTVIAVPDAKLKPGEVAVFEIRLRHI